jgi:hypothetical protein
MKPGYFFGLAVVLTLCALLALRYNMVTVERMQQAIIEKDKTGENVTTDIEELRKFALSHSQSSVQFTLTGRYERAQQKAEDEAVERQTGKLYEQAQAACDRPGVSSIAQAECVQKYVSARLKPGQNPQPYEPPEPSDPEFSVLIASPAWAPDLAGFLLLGALLSAIVAGVIYLKHLIYFEHHKR